MSAIGKQTEPSVNLQRPIIVILLGVLAVVALVTTSPIAYWLLYAIGSVVVLSYFWTRHAVRNIRMRRRLQTKWVTVGDVIEEEFELVNTSRFPVLVIEIEDHSELPGYQASVAESLGGLQTRRWQTRGTAGRRGFFSLGPADLRVGDPFGFFSAERHDDRKIDVVVYPPISVMSDVAIPAGAMVGTSRSSIRTQQVTSDAGGIRNFQPGDPLKRIHWPSTARRDELIVKEFELEPTASLWIALDLERGVQAGHGDESTEEYGVKIVSSLAYQLVRDNKSVGFIAMGRDGRYLVEPQKGLKQLWRILETLAVVQARGSVAFGEFLTASAPALGRGVSLVAVTPSSDPTWMISLAHLAHRSIYPLAIGLDASSFDGAASNLGLKDHAAAAGVQFVTVKRGTEFTTIRPDGQTRADFERSRRRPVTLAPA